MIDSPSPSIPCLRRWLGWAALGALPGWLPAQASPSPAEVRQLALTHSGAYDLYFIDDQPVGGSLYPYVARMAEAGGRSYRMDGTFFALMGNPGGLAQQVAEITQDGWISQWHPDADLPLDVPPVPGATFAEKAYDSFVISPPNFIQAWFNEETGEMLTDEEGNPAGINPQSDPEGFAALVQEYVAAFNALHAADPDIVMDVYTMLPPAFPFFPETDNEAADNTITLAHVHSYAEFSLGLFQGWYDAFLDAIRAHPELSDGVMVREIPSNRLVGEFLAERPEVLVGRDWFDFARDGAPHFGSDTGESDFFEAFLAPVFYTVLFRERVPEAFSLSEGNIFAADFPAFVDHLAEGLLARPASLMVSLAPAAGEVTLRVSTRTGFSYSVHASDDLNQWSTAISFPGDGGEVATTAPAPESGARFFRASESPAP